MTTIPRTAVTLYLFAAWAAFAVTGQPVLSAAAGVPVGLLYASFETVQP